MVFSPFAWWEGIYEKEREKYYEYSESTKDKKLEEVEIETMKDNIYEEIGKTLEDNMILVEPDVQLKMYHLMGIGGDKEIAGKLVTEEEGGYIVIKDIIIPYQTVGKSSWDSYDEQLAKFLYELNFEDNNPDKDPETGKARGKRRSNEEIQAIKTKLNGHWHSHNSLSRSSKPSPSPRDTKDMWDNRDKRRYWIELISSFAGTSGRIMMDNPRIEREVEVKLKWWTGIEETLKECEGRIFTETYSYSWKKKKKKDKKKKEKEEDNDEELSAEQTTAVTVYDDKVNKRVREIDEILERTNKHTNNLYNNMDSYRMCRIYGVIGKDAIGLEWLPTDPIQLSISYMNSETQGIISLAFERIVNPNEKIVVEVYRSGKISWEIYDEKGWVCNLLSRFNMEYPEEYKTYSDLMESWGLTEDAGAWVSDKSLYPTPRTITWSNAVQLYHEYLNAVKGLEYDEIIDKEFSDEVRDEIMRQINSGEL